MREQCVALRDAHPDFLLLFQNSETAFRTKTGSPAQAPTRDGPLLQFRNVLKLQEAQRRKPAGTGHPRHSRAAGSSSFLPWKERYDAKQPHATSETHTRCAGAPGSRAVHPRRETLSLELDALIRSTRVLQGAPSIGRGPERPWPKLSVMDATSSQAVHRAPSGTRVTVLNFASGTRVGGDFLTGSLAQEEDLCRTSTLFASLSCGAARPFYEAGRAADAMGAHAALLSPDVFFFLDDGGQPIIPRRANVISCAAPNLREFPGDQGRQRQAGELIRTRTHLVLRAAGELETDHLILGAWGCGVFGNDPGVVAPAMLFALREHLHRHDSTLSEVTFAIPEPRPGGPDNLTTFLEAVLEHGGRARE